MKVLTDKWQKMTLMQRKSYKVKSMIDAGRGQMEVSLSFRALNCIGSPRVARRRLQLSESLC